MVNGEVVTILKQLERLWVLAVIILVKPVIMFIGMATVVKQEKGIT